MFSSFFVCHHELCALTPLIRADFGDIQKERKVTREISRLLYQKNAKYVVFYILQIYVYIPKDTIPRGGPFHEHRAFVKRNVRRFVQCSK